MGRPCSSRCRHFSSRSPSRDFFPYIRVLASLPGLQVIFHFVAISLRGKSANPCWNLALAIIEMASICKLLRNRDTEPFDVCICGWRFESSLHSVCLRRTFKFVPTLSMHRFQIIAIQFVASMRLYCRCTEFQTLRIVCTGQPMVIQPNSKAR